MLFLRSHLDTSTELRFSLGSLAETQSDHYRSAKVIRRPRRGRLGLRETKVTAWLLFRLQKVAAASCPLSRTGSNRKSSYC